MLATLIVILHTHPHLTYPLHINDLKMHITLVTPLNVPFPPNFCHSHLFTVMHSEVL
uniref:Uncharacterized protein n=1 Tax=Anguilla anguilla TaxID=7936 RepID=A0A0E9WVG8_ANGAN